MFKVYVGLVVRKDENPWCLSPLLALHDRLRQLFRRSPLPRALQHPYHPESLPFLLLINLISNPPHDTILVCFLHCHVSSHPLRGTSFLFTWHVYDHPVMHLELLCSQSRNPTDSIAYINPKPIPQPFIHHQTKPSLQIDSDFLLPLSYSVPFQISSIVSTQWHISKIHAPTQRIRLSRPEARPTSMETQSIKPRPWARMVRGLALVCMVGSISSSPTNNPAAL